MKEKKKKKERKKDKKESKRREEKRKEVECPAAKDSWRPGGGSFSRGLTNGRDLEQAEVGEDDSNNDDNYDDDDCDQN